MESNGGLSVNLVQYLKDSFEAYDVDDNAGLGPDEFWKVVNVVLVETINGLKDTEIEELRVRSAHTYINGLILLLFAFVHNVKYIPLCFSGSIRYGQRWVDYVERSVAEIH